MASTASGNRPRSTVGRRKPRAQRWTEILDAASRVFFEKGYDAASLQMIADQLGMLKGSLYYHIQSKEELLFEVLDRVYRRGLGSLETAAKQDGPVLDRLHAAIVGHIGFMADNLTGIAVFLRELDMLPADRRGELLGPSGGYQRVFRKLVAEGGETGELLPDVDPKLATLSLLGSLNWFHRWYVPGGEFTVQEIGRRISLVFLRGVATSEALQAFLERADERSAEVTEQCRAERAEQ